jgi:hypothetical protein
VDLSPRQSGGSGEGGRILRGGELAPVVGGRGIGNSGRRRGACMEDLGENGPSALPIATSDRQGEEEGA